MEVNGHPYICPSALGLKFAGTDLFPNDFSVIHVSNHSVQEEWVPTYGERSYLIPEQPTINHFVIASEETQFHLPKGCFAYEEHELKGNTIVE